MSAPDTNLEKQTKRHKGPLYGIVIVLAFVAALFLAYSTWIVSQADEASTPLQGAADVVTE